MLTTTDNLDEDLLAAWITGRTLPVRASKVRAATAQGLRFAFYGRISTERFQDRSTSQAWQLGGELAQDQIVVHGRPGPGGPATFLGEHRPDPLGPAQPGDPVPPGGRAGRPGRIRRR